MEDRRDIANVSSNVNKSSEIRSSVSVMVAIKFFLNDLNDLNDLSRRLTYVGKS